MKQKMTLKLVAKTRQEAKEILYQLASKDNIIILDVCETYYDKENRYEIIFEANIEIPNVNVLASDGKTTSILSNNKDTEVVEN
uniref:hypothetical protein n=1 Tax=Methanobrevibacter smithii TaxID=2173 RepID=UPI0037DCBD7A